MRRSMVIGFALCLCCGLIGAMPSAGAADPPDIGRSDADVKLEWGIKIPMRDGVELNATIYKPKQHSEPLATIVTITPYISDRYHPDALYFARHGFAFVIVDTRGRGSSGGQFQPLREGDGIDGHDIVEWLAQQDWSDGQVAMRGGSYGGYNQWATARHRPKHLTTIVPIASPYPGLDFPMNFNTPYPYAIRWATLTSGRTPNNRLFGDSAFWRTKFRDYHTRGIAFADLDKLVGNTSTIFAEWIQHPTLDDYYTAAAPSDNELRHMNLPILTITGYYDGDQPGAMHHYRRHMQHAMAAAKAQHYLILGPWNHSGTRLPEQSFGGYTFGDAMLFDAFALDKDWYNWTLRGAERPAFIKDRVTYFVAGNNEWKSAPALDAIADRQLTYYLASNGYAGDVYRAGSLLEQATQSAPADTYIYDPLDTSKAQREPSDEYITDQSEITMTHGDGLIYHTAPFAEATEISGYVRFEAWLELNVPDTDINVTLYEIKDDGSSIALSGQTLRARYRTSLQRETLIEPDAVNLYQFNNFYFFSRLIAKDSRLRLFIRPANGLMQQRNYNSGTAVNFETRADARTAEVKLYHTSDYPSRLILPVVDRP